MPMMDQLWFLLRRAGIFLQFVQNEGKILKLCCFERERIQGERLQGACPRYLAKMSRELYPFWQRVLLNNIRAE